MGLAISYSIIKNHDGLIQVQSQVDMGTTFTLYIPASPHTVTILPTETGNTASLPSIIGRVLIMDDEVIVREMLMEILKYLGCESVSASDGYETIALYMEAQKKNNPFVLNVNYIVRFATIILSGFLFPKLTDFCTPFHC